MPEASLYYLLQVLCPLAHWFMFMNGYGGMIIDIINNPNNMRAKWWLLEANTADGQYLSISPARQINRHQ